MSIRIGNIVMNGSNSFQANAVKGNREVVEEQRPLEDGFSRVEASGIDTLRILPGKNVSELSISGESNLLAHFETKVEDGVLRIGMAENTALESHEKVAVTLLMEQPLSHLELSSSTEASIESQVADRLKVALNGSSQAHLASSPQQLLLEQNSSSQFSAAALATQSVRAELNGSSQADLAGSTRSLEVEQNSSSQLLAHSLDAQTVTAGLSGSAKAELFGKLGDLQLEQMSSSRFSASHLDANLVRVDLSGSSQAQLGGQTRKLELEQLSSSVFLGIGLHAQQAWVEMSGNSQGQVHPVETLQASTSSNASLTLSGEGQLTKDVSGNSKITHLLTGEVYKREK